jgi:DNA-directed RNA polymerase subunit RPC12/RpoP
VEGILNFVEGLSMTATGINFLCAKCGGSPEAIDDGTRYECKRCGVSRSLAETRADVKAHHDYIAKLAVQRKAMGIGEKIPWIHVTTPTVEAPNLTFVTDLTPENYFERTAEPR